MKIWVTPELLEMKASFTQMVLNKSGSDALGDEAENPSTHEMMPLGSCC